METSALAFYVVVVCALIAVLWLMLQPLWLRLRRAHLRRRAFPPAWRGILRKRVALYAQLPTDLQLRLKQDMLVFLAEKPFLGCAGLQVSEEMRVTVAALACMPLLGARRGYYPRLQRVLMYPGAFVARHQEVGADGVHNEGLRAMSGQSWADGQVLLSWDDVLRDAADPGLGRNVVIHEFAHQLDQLKGFANGAPPLRNRQTYQAWSQVMQREYDALRWRLAQAEHGVQGSSDIGMIEPYAATDPAEFFAVCSELFFARPQELADQHTALFSALRFYYRINPVSWS